MQIVTSYKIKIKNHNDIFEKLLAIYREALSYLILVVDAEWDTVKDITGTKAQAMYIERLTHGTKNRIAKYEFDERYYKFPSYLRRSAINDAIGKVSSYRANYEKWNNKGRKGGEPTLQTKHYAYPALFRDNMYVRDD
ncbi:MAG: transposase, partial [Oscillospiraceae bacterium]|nr:transposase [Oscillospiraceae bacterium]